MSQNRESDIRAAVLNGYTLRRIGKDDSIGMVTFKGGHRATLHRHPEFEIHYLTNCKGATRIVGDYTDNVSGTLLTLIGSQVPHRFDFYSAPDNPDQFEVLFFGLPKLISNSVIDRSDMVKMRELKRRAQYGLAFGQDTIKKVEKVIERLMKIEQPSKLVIFHHMIEIVCIMAEAEDAKELSRDPQGKPQQGIIDKRVSDALSYLESNYMTVIKCEDVAKVMDMAVHSANRLFKQNIGHTIIDFLVATRLEHAARMLLESNITISEACYKSGFNNLSYFNRIFRRKYHCTPKEFRETYGN